MLGNGFSACELPLSSTNGKNQAEGNEAFAVRLKLTRLNLASTSFLTALAAAPLGPPGNVPNRASISSAMDRSTFPLIFTHSASRSTLIREMTGSSWGMMSVSAPLSSDCVYW